MRNNTNECSQRANCVAVLNTLYYPLLTILIDLLDDLIQLLSCRVLSQHPHHLTQLLGADITATVGVEHVKGGLELWRKNMICHSKADRKI